MTTACSLIPMDFRLKTEHFSITTLEYIQGLLTKMSRIRIVRKPSIIIQITTVQIRLCLINVFDLCYLEEEMP